MAAPRDASRELGFEFQNEFARETLPTDKNGLCAGGEKGIALPCERSSFFLWEVLLLS